MQIINYLEVGKPQREKIEELDTLKAAARSEERLAKKALVDETVITKLLEAKDPTIKLTITNNEGRISFDRDDRSWGWADVYIHDTWTKNDKEYDVRFSASSFSGYTSNENRDNLAEYAEMTRLTQMAANLLELQIHEWKKIEDRFLKLTNKLYTEAREYKEELKILLDKAEKKNEEMILAKLENDYDLSPAFRDGQNGLTIYTGYGDDYRVIETIKLLRTSAKSVLLEGKKTWSSGEEHTLEFRVKKDDLFEQILSVEYCKLDKENEDK